MTKQFWSTNENPSVSCWLKIKSFILVPEQDRAGRDFGDHADKLLTATEAQRGRVSSRASNKCQPLSICPVLISPQPPSSVCVCVDGFHEGIPRVQTLLRLALVYSGPAGSRPARTNMSRGLSSQPQGLSSWIHCTPTQATLSLDQNPPTRTQR